MTTNNPLPTNVRKVWHTNPDGGRVFHFAVTLSCGHDEHTFLGFHYLPNAAQLAASMAAGICQDCLKKQAAAARREARAARKSA